MAADNTAFWKGFAENSLRKTAAPGGGPLFTGIVVAKSIDPSIPASEAGDVIYKVGADLGQVYKKELVTIDRQTRAEPYLYMAGTQDLKFNGTAYVFISGGEDWLRAKLGNVGLRMSRGKTALVYVTYNTENDSKVVEVLETQMSKARNLNK